MCNPKLLLIFLSLCQGYFTAPNPPDISVGKCVKSLDICVDRELWEYEDTLVSMNEKEREDAAISSCDYLLNGRGEFSMYYTDNRCGWN